MEGRRAPPALISDGDSGESTTSPAKVVFELIGSWHFRQSGNDTAAGFPYA
jgi:hypothetical protein